jgi:hypothetical protein
LKGKGCGKVKHGIFRAVKLPTSHYTGGMCHYTFVKTHKKYRAKTEIGEE